ncbi:hypothetical protein BC941DRAFT_430413 [Chlamydoabsidia padenii]|nr:hypothetical protein BC941DRAFT_430413 [Chlamydoabsidia padenii]
MTSREDIIKQRLLHYKPNQEELTVIRSAVFHLITYVGTFTGLAFGGLLGMSQGMQKVRQNLPQDSPLLAIIMENEQLKQQELNRAMADIVIKAQENDKVE